MTAEEPLPVIRRAGLVASLLVLAGVSWVLIVTRMGGMGGMGAGPGTSLGGPGSFTAVWVIMMAAMMLPSITPVVLGYARIHWENRDRERTPPAGATAAFVAGYLVSWGVAGLLSYAIIEGVRALDAGFLAQNLAAPHLAGGVILVAAVYQLTPLKDISVRHCRSPLMLRQHWHPGHLGALRMGIEHGRFCIGCCWALMAALFALGLMSIGWMAFITALIAVEKLLPWKTVANRSTAVVLAVLGIAVAFAPEQVPGLMIGW